MTRTELENKVNQIFKDGNFVAWEFFAKNDTDVYVYIEDGDWKHEHGYLKHLMRTNGFVCIEQRQVGEDTGGDWYSCEYVFRLI